MADDEWVEDVHYHGWNLGVRHRRLHAAMGTRLRMGSPTVIAETLAQDPWADPRRWAWAAACSYLRGDRAAMHAWPPDPTFAVLAMVSLHLLSRGVDAADVVHDNDDDDDDDDDVVNVNDRREDLFGRAQHSVLWMVLCSFDLPCLTRLLDMLKMHPDMDGAGMADLKAALDSKLRAHAWAVLLAPNAAKAVLRWLYDNHWVTLHSTLAGSFIAAVEEDHNLGAGDGRELFERVHCTVASWVPEAAASWAAGGGVRVHARLSEGWVTLAMETLGSVYGQFATPGVIAAKVRGAQDYMRPGRLRALQRLHDHHNLTLGADLTGCHDAVENGARLRRLLRDWTHVIDPDDPWAFMDISAWLTTPSTDPIPGEPEE
jgi:hypothetical protein